MRTLPSYNGVAGIRAQKHSTAGHIHSRVNPFTGAAPYPWKQPNPSGHTTSASPGHVHSSGAAESQKLKCPCQGLATIMITVLSPQINAAPTSQQACQKASSSYHCSKVESRMWVGPHRPKAQVCCQEDLEGKEACVCREKRKEEKVSAPRTWAQAPGKPDQPCLPGFPSCRQFA